MAVTDETEAEVRALRERAIEYADRVMAGEQPWEDEEADVTDAPDDAEPRTAEADAAAPANDDVGETGVAGNEVVEVEQDDPAVEPDEA